MFFLPGARARFFVAAAMSCLACIAAPVASAQQLSVADVSMSEGDSGTKSMDFTIKLSSASAMAVRVDVATADISASAASDYGAASVLALRFPAGTTSKTFSVIVSGDTTSEADETFAVNLSNPVGASISDSQAIGTITDDDLAPTPALSISDVSAWEGNSGNSPAIFTISLSQPSASNVSVTVTTAAGTASGASSDYVALSTTKVIWAGQTQVNVTVPLIGDTQVEQDETFSLNLSNAVNAVIADGQGIGTILDDDANPVPPDAPTNVVATAALLGADVSFDAPASTGTGRISGYMVTSYPAGGVDDASGSSSTTHHMSGLVKGTDYTFTVIATTQSGTSPASQPSNSMRPLALPGPVDNVQLQPGSQMVTVSFDPPADPGDFEIIGYLVMTTDGSGYDSDAQSLSTTHRIQGLTVAQPYTFSIRAITNEGLGDEVITGPATPGSVPGAPVIGSATGSGSTATVTFSPPASDGGSPITGYVVRGGAYCQSVIDTNGGGLSLSHLVTNLPANTPCTFTAYAINSAGEGPGSAASNQVTYVRPDMYISFPEIPEGNSGTSTLAFTITLSAPAPSPVSFDVSTHDGSATAGSDYVARSNVHMVIPAGESTATFEVTVNGDTTVEPTEDFRINLTNIDGAWSVSNGYALGTIADDDGVPVPKLSVDDFSFVEGNSGTSVASLLVKLDIPAPAEVSFNLTTTNGTAISGMDYAALALTGVKIPAGQSSVIVPVTIIGDTLVEGDENIIFNVTNVAGATVVDGSALGFITNDDTGFTPSISIDDVSIDEGNSGTKIATFTVTLSGPSSTAVTYDIATVDSTATAGSDYVAKSLTGETIPANATSREFTVVIQGDTTVEQGETFKVRITNVANALVDDSQAYGYILNDDEAVVPTLSIADASISEGNSGSKNLNFTVSLTSPAAEDVTFDLVTSDGTAIGNIDFMATGPSGVKIPAGQTSVQVPIAIYGDTTVEEDETFTVNLAYVFGAPVTDGAATGTITNDDGTAGPTLSIADVAIAEGNTGTKVATFTVTLSAAQTTAVKFDIATADGTATAGSDYVAASALALRIPAGNTSKTFAVTINGDTTQEPNETFLVNLANPIGATLADAQAVGTITNDDAAATPTLSIADAAVTEGNSGTKVLSFTVNLSPAASGTVSYDIATSNGSATAGSDYVASNLTGQTITAGGTSKTFAVTINGDATNEANETFNVTLSNVSGATLGDGSAVGTITNDDGSGGTPTLTIADVSVAEGNSLSKQMTFTVKLSAAATGPVTYNIATANGTALAPGDYTAKTLTGQSIAAGATSKTFTVAIKGDKVVEPNETFLVNVTGVSGATVGDGQAVGTISNDDAAAITIARFDAGDLVDDVDDGNRVLQLSKAEYATLLIETARTLCRRAPDATLLAVDGIEHRQVLAELADAASLVCSGNRKYTAIMGGTSHTGFLVEVGKADVLEAPRIDAAGMASLRVRGEGQPAPVVLLAPPPIPPNAAERAAQMRAIARAVQSLRVRDRDARFVLIGEIVVPGLLDLTARQFASGAAASSQPPAERVLVSPTLEAAASLRMPVLPAAEPSAQVLQLQ